MFRIAILVAMDKELGLLLNQMPDREEINIGENKYYAGRIGDKEVIAGKCGIGKVNSALNTYRLICDRKPDIVINSGVAGGVDGSLGIGSVLIADSVAYHDVWCGPGTEYGAADGFKAILTPDEKIITTGKTLFKDNGNVRFGLICSGDKFIHEKKEVEEIKSRFPQALAVDMESASIAQTCTRCGIPFAIIRVMSDTPGAAENVSQYVDFWNKAPEKTFECVSRIIKNL